LIYSCKEYSDKLVRTSLVTGEQSSHRVPSYTFNQGCCWSEEPEGSLLITGGGVPAVGEVVRIDVGTFEVSPQRDMHTLEEDMLQCITLNISTSLEGTIADT
jgi:hypothetical protein